MSNSFSAVLTLGRDAEVKHLASGVPVLSFSGACNTGYGDKRKTMWVRVSAFGKIAEGTLVNFLVKGQSVFCSGELSQNEYTGADSSLKTSIELTSSMIELIGKKLDAMESSAPPKQNKHVPQTAYDKLYGGKRSNSGENIPQDFNDDLPF